MTSVAQSRHITDYLNARDLPDGESGRVSIRRIVVTEEEARWGILRGGFSGGISHIRPGTYTGLYRGDALWMSDTPDEQRDHMGAVMKAVRLGAESALVNGLGIGMVLNALLHVPTMRRVDVVEIDPDVVALVEPHYQRIAAERGVELVVHTDDAYTITWPKEARWDIAWHDIWQDATTDNLAEMGTLHRRYGRRVRWQGSWKREYLQYLQRRDRRAGW